MTKKEREELQSFIVEGDWTNENATFNETYSANDIIDTLKGVLNEATQEFNQYISKETYDFSVDIANIKDIYDGDFRKDELKLGHAVILESETGVWQTPVLMEMHTDYTEPTNNTFTFSTNYKQKSLLWRFTKLFGTISQTSVTTPTFTFDN